MKERVVNNVGIKNHFIDSLVRTTDYKRISDWYKYNSDKLQRNQAEKVFSKPQVSVSDSRVYSVRKINGVLHVVPSDIIIVDDHKKLLKSDSTSSSNLL